MNAIKRLLAAIYRMFEQQVAEHIGDDEEEASEWQAHK